MKQQPSAKSVAGIVDRIGPPNTSPTLPRHGSKIPRTSCMFQEFFAA
jgi:hypothetical protein